MFIQKPFSFSADCKTLEQSIKKVVAVVSSQANFFISVYKKKVCVLGLGADTFVLLEVPNSETEASNGIFGFDATVLPGLIKGRSVMNFKFDSGKCSYAQVKGRYSGEIPALSVTEDQLENIRARVEDKSKGSTAIDADTWASIKAGIAATGVKDVYQNTTLMSYVTLRSGRLVIASFDAQHFGLFRSRVKNDASFRAALPQSHFSLIEQVSGGTDTTFSITPTRLRASGDGFIIILPATQAEDKHFSMVPDFVKNLPKPMYEAEGPIDKLTTIADNLYTLYSANSNFTIRTKGDVFTIGLSTSSGSASDSVRMKAQSKDVKLSVDPRLMMDILNLAKPLKTVTIRVTDKVLSMYGKLGNAEVVLACSRAE